MHLRCVRTSGGKVETRACGTGAVAAAVADHAELVVHYSAVRMPGGTLRVQLHEPEETTGAYQRMVVGAARSCAQLGTV